MQLEVGAEGLYEHGRYEAERAPYTGIDGSPQPAIDRELGLGRSRIGAFATAALRPTARLTVSPGLRVDYNALAGEAYAQPRLALAYQLTGRVTATAAAGLYRQAVPLWIAGQADGNRDLSDPQALHLVGGMDVQLAPEILLTVEGFWKDYSDVPEATPGNPLQVPAYALDARGGFVGPLQSTGEAEAYGVEALVQKKLASGLYGLMSAAYVRARYEGPRRCPAQPRLRHARPALGRRRVEAEREVGALGALELPRRAPHYAHRSGGQHRGGRGGARLLARQRGPATGLPQPLRAAATAAGASGPPRSPPS